MEKATRDFVFGFNEVLVPLVERGFKYSYSAGQLKNNKIKYDNFLEKVERFKKECNAKAMGLTCASVDPRIIEVYASWCAAGYYIDWKNPEMMDKFCHLTYSARDVFKQIVEK